MTAPTPSLGTNAPAERAWAQVEEALRSTLIGEYEIRGLIGRGGMAAVYLADELVLDRKVAIKVMSPALVYGDGMVDRFRREAKTIAGLSHPHIIPLHRVVERGDVLAIIMKFINGRPLDSIIDETGPMPLPMVQSILAQVSSALAYAHRKGVVHRDIKPANIMIDDDGSAVVCDFGIAKAAGVETPLTMTGATVGTPRYMSPEQWMGEGISGAADQYSLGVVTFEMLTGQPPFAGSSVMDVMAQHLNQPTPKVESIRRDVSPTLSQVVNRMLAKAPSERFPSLDTVARTLDRSEPAHEEAVRSQLMTLATSGDRHRRLAAMLRQSVPVSPVPASRSSTTVPRGEEAGAATTGYALAGRAARWAGVLVVAAVIAGAGWFAARTSIQDDEQPQTTPGGSVGAVQRTPPSSATGASAPVVPDTMSASGANATPSSSPALGPTRSRPVPAQQVPTGRTAQTKDVASKDSSVSSARGPVPAIGTIATVDSTLQRRVAPLVDSPPVTSITPPAPPAPATVRIGTRDPNNVLYVNGVAQTPQAGLRTFKFPVGGSYSFSVRAVGCTSWDTTITVAAGDAVALNYKNARCP